ncbi:DNA repair and recombination protein RadB [Candidatus Woesearchaeota archaeon]|nr:DNA repair and recombination protein RadB [Candidatus Woesearchaeota archaeon]
MDEKVQTGSAVFDELLEGGYEKGVLTTIYGPPGSGKTTTCLLSAIAQPKQKKIIFMDTEGGFSTSRLKQLSKDYRSVLERTFIIRPTSFELQKNAVEQIQKLVSPRFGIIICDTISALYRTERGPDNKALNKELSRQLTSLLEIARTKNIPVLLTNQVYSDFDDKSSIKMVGGDIINYSSKCLIELGMLSGNARQATLRKHRSLPEKTGLFRIEEQGFSQVKNQ